MKTIKHFLVSLLCISLCLSLTQAQPAPHKQQDAQTTNTIAQDVLIIIQQVQVLFTSQKAVAEMRLQIFDQAGQMVYDSGVVTGPELTWVLRQSSGETVKSGLYAYTLSVKEAGAETARVRRGHFIVDRAKDRDGQTDRLWITSQNEGGVGTELTVARNEGATIAGTSVTSERQSVKAGDKEQPEGQGEPTTRNETKEAAFAPAAVTGQTTIQGSEDPLLEVDHTGASGNPAIWFKQDGAPKAYIWWNQYGNVTTDAKGLAVVTLPSYFTALNHDYRYQLTVVGKFAQAIVSSEIKNNRFTIKTNRPQVKVSWQVTGIRQDAYAKANPIRVEEEKPDQERGAYLHPEAFGQPKERSAAHARPSASTQQAEEETGKGGAAARPMAPDKR